MTSHNTSSLISHSKPGDHHLPRPVAFEVNDENGDYNFNVGQLPVWAKKQIGGNQSSASSQQSTPVPPGLPNSFSFCNFLQKIIFIHWFRILEISWEIKKFLFLFHLFQSETTYVLHQKSEILKFWPHLCPASALVEFCGCQSTSSGHQKSAST